MARRRKLIALFACAADAWYELVEKRRVIEKKRGAANA